MTEEPIVQEVKNEIGSEVCKADVIQVYKVKKGKKKEERIKRPTLCEIKRRLKQSKTNKTGCGEKRISNVSKKEKIVKVSVGGVKKRRKRMKSIDKAFPVPSYICHMKFDSKCTVNVNMVNKRNFINFWLNYMSLIDSFQVYLLQFPLSFISL